MLITILACSSIVLAFVVCLYDTIVKTNEDEITIEQILRVKPINGKPALTEADRTALIQRILNQ